MRTLRAVLIFAWIALAACGRTSSELAPLDGAGANAGAGGKGGAAFGGTGGDSGGALGSAGSLDAAASGGSSGATGAGGIPDGIPSFIAPSIGRSRDVAHDAKRQMLYVSTAAGLERYDLKRRAFDEPLLAGKSLLGVDLSPDQNTLLIADEAFVTADASTLARNWIHVVDLENGSVRQLEFSDELYEAGTYMPLFLDDHVALVSTSYPGSGGVPLRRVNVADGSYEIVTEIGQDSALVRSANGSVVAFAESNISSGDFGYYRIADGSIEKGTTDWFNSTIGVSRDGKQFAVPTYGGLFVYDDSLTQTGWLGTYATTYPVAAVHSPVADVLYLAWNDDDGVRPTLEAYDTVTLTPLAAIASGNHYPSTEFAPGMLRTSRDGKWIFMLMSWEGIHAYPVDP